MITNEQELQTIRDRDAAEEAHRQAGAAITAALVMCQRAKCRGDVLDRLLEAKAALLAKAAGE